MSIRQDAGGLWENFCIVERMKLLQGVGRNANFYFWRTRLQKEIDLIEERDGKLYAFGFKWAPNKIKAPKAFTEAYPESEFTVIDKTNFLHHLVIHSE